MTTDSQPNEERTRRFLISYHLFVPFLLLGLWSLLARETSLCDTVETRAGSSSRRGEVKEMKRRGKEKELAANSSSCFSFPSPFLI